MSGTDSPRILELRRRVQQDPASIAFAQLAEEYRRAGDLQSAVRVSRDGLQRHPAYASARVTLARALVQLGDLDGAEAEFEQARRLAPDNLAAIRGLADLHQRRGQLGDALAEYREALSLATNDPELETKVARLAAEASGGVDAGSAIGAPVDDAARARDRRLLALLERWLDRILADRESRQGQ
ncbi:MAG: tetratricopeptide repeat protein [Acidobacteriota bacterium]|nr:tetratricopeptide repeat protein [Acidobacteriota bacterium]